MVIRIICGRPALLYTWYRMARVDRSSSHIVCITCRLETSRICTLDGCANLETPITRAKHNRNSFRSSELVQFPRTTYTVTKKTKEWTGGELNAGPLPIDSMKEFIVLRKHHTIPLLEYCILIAEFRLLTH